MEWYVQFAHQSLYLFEVTQLLASQTRDAISEFHVFQYVKMSDSAVDAAFFSQLAWSTSKSLT